MVNITELAAQKVKEVLKAQNKENALLRLYLVGVGCGGPNFGMTLDESKTEDDILDEEYGVSMIIDKKLSTHLEGAIVDYVESDNGGGFEIRTAKTGNGDACGSGGCGGCGGCGGSC
jgi:iron-sulfur cluster assembly accessory protein